MLPRTISGRRALKFSEKAKSGFVSRVRSNPVPQARNLNSPRAAYVHVQPHLNTFVNSQRTSSVTSILVVNFVRVSRAVDKRNYEYISVYEKKMPDRP